MKPGAALVIVVASAAACGDAQPAPGRGAAANEVSPADAAGLGDRVSRAVLGETFRRTWTEDLGAGESAPASETPRRLCESAVEEELLRLQRIADLKGLDFATAIAGPFVVLQEIVRVDVRDVRQITDTATGMVSETPVAETVDPSKVRRNRELSAKAYDAANRTARLLEELERQFKEMFAAACSLPQLPAVGRALPCAVLWDEDGFRSFCDATRVALPIRLGVATYRFDATARRAISYLGLESHQGKDEWPTAGEFVQKSSDVRTLCVAARQLLDAYARAKQRVTSDETQPSMPYWLAVGVSEFIAGAEVDSGGVATLESATWRHGRIRLDLVDAGRRNRDRAGTWSLTEVLGAERDAPVARTGRPRSPWNAGEYPPRAWALCHFLLSYDGGRYRTAFLRLLSESIDGSAGADAFDRIVAPRNGPIEREFEWYWGQLLQRKVGVDRVLRQPLVVVTDAPAGRVEDDAEFCEVWDETRRASSSEDGK